MIDVAQLRKVYADKLEATGSFDQAFTKAVWVAFKLGIESTKKGNENESNSTSSKSNG